jgi:hypothetical protein
VPTLTSGRRGELELAESKAESTLQLRRIHGDPHSLGSGEIMPPRERQLASVLLEQ